MSPVPPNVVYVAPYGNDTNSGTFDEPVKTYHRGLTILMADGGGTLRVQPGCSASPYDGAGVYLRSATNDPGPGGAAWVDQTGPIKIEGVGGFETVPQSW